MRYLTNKPIVPKDPNLKIINEYARPNMNNNVIFEKDTDEVIPKNEEEPVIKEPKE